ncbi:TPA: hypothetical protein I7730_01665 [Vibrio vulnificus]|uniref:Uncharacterized protein n=1 Tax=Vibrio vulnificus TaxID=672 RepID=A0A8H9K5J7_VIBVL|nr:hypothetical protein [Vibrio vulnificus]HAS8538505.1 hypothetical protein [Vibrio vulnificus]
MANEPLTTKLRQLAEAIGGVRAIASAIKGNTGYSPSKSAIDRAMKGSCSDYSVCSMIRDLEEAKSNWFIFEVNTLVWDGHYTGKKQAQFIAGYQEAYWKGSKWIVMSSSEMFLSKEQFHRNSNSQSLLEGRFGEPDYAAADLYDRS